MRRWERWFGVKVWCRSSAARSMLKGECFWRMEFISGGMEYACRSVVRKELEIGKS